MSIPVAPGVSIKKPRKRKSKGPMIEIEELWQPNEEQKQVLFEKIDWKTAIKHLNKLADENSQKAFEAMVNIKDLVGPDRFADAMIANVEFGSCELHAKISKHGVKRTYY